jgi:hypothetical protein
MGCLCYRDGSCLTMLPIQTVLRKNSVSLVTLLGICVVLHMVCTYAEILLVAYGWLMLRLGLRSGEVTPSPPSRPLSALSQQSMNSVNCGVSLRARPVAASRKPRPISIAVTGVTQESDSQTVRASHRHSEPLSLLFTLVSGQRTY